MPLGLIATHRTDTTVRNLVSDRHVEMDVPTCFENPVVHLRVGRMPGRQSRYAMQDLGAALVRWLQRHGFEAWDIARLVVAPSLPDYHAEITLTEKLPERRTQR